MKRTRLWLWFLLLLPLGAGLARLRPDVEILRLLPDNLNVARGLQIYQENFADARELIITVEASTALETEAAARSLAELLRRHTNLVSQVMWQPAWMDRPEDAAELIAALWLNQPPAELRQLVDRLAVTNLPVVLETAREELATSFSPQVIALGGYDPVGFMRLPESVVHAAPGIGSGEDLFVTRGGTFRLLFTQAKPDLNNYRSCRAWLTEVQQLIQQAQREGRISPEAKLHYTGRPVFVTEIASGMEGDMAGSAGGTLAIIGILFWFTHRRLRPLFWLLTVLVLILAGTTALGGLLLGTINVVSMGFASILLGLSEDFGIVIYQESRSHPELSEGQLRRVAAPGIFWSAVTTAGAFLVLNLSTLPGLRQLGTLVAIGLILSAFVMLYGYLPVLLRLRRERDIAPAGEKKERLLLFTTGRVLPASLVWLITLGLSAAATLLLCKEGLQFDHSPNVLKPKNSEADATLESIKANFGRSQAPLWVLIPGRDETQISQRLAEVESTLARAVTNQLIERFTLPTALWPNPENQRANRPMLAALVAERAALRQAALAAGFTANSLVMTEAILEHWQRALQTPGVFWPANETSRWILSKVVARPDHAFLALGLIHPASRAATDQLMAEWPQRLEAQGIILSGWELLGSTVFATVIRELPRVLVPIFLLVVVSLWLAFRRWKEVGLSLISLSFSALVLAAAMHLLHWDWNLLNLMALPLLLGMGVDFGIHIQLALRRYEGDLLVVRRSVGRALLLAGATTVAGFGSLAFSTNAGMASLGKVCALGIIVALLTAVYLLPVWWKAWGESNAECRMPNVE